MKIGIDIRSLMEQRYTGVSEYVFNLLNNLFKIDNKNEYKLFYNSFHNNAIQPGFFAQEKINKNIKHCRFKIPNKILNAGFVFLKYPKIDRMLKDIDILFIPNFLFSSFSSKIKNVITVHDLSFERERFAQFYTLKGKLWHKFVNTRNMCRQADLIIAVSENTKYDIMEIYGIPEKKIKVIYSGIPLLSPSLQKNNNFKLPDKFILFLGNIELRKNILGIIDAFELLNTKYKITDYELLIAGSKGYGYGGEMIYKKAKVSAASEKIKFIGYVENHDKALLYKKASLFFYPAFYEGFGFPPLEAMLCSTPVITSNSSSLPEVVGDAALMVDPYNTEDMARGIAQVLSDSALRELLAKKGLERAKIFSWEKCGREVLEALENV